MIKIDFKHDLAEMVKKNLHSYGIRVPKEWDSYTTYMKYLQIYQRWFNSNIPYEVKYSKELLEKLPQLTQAERDALKDIEYRLKTCEPLTPYMSKDIRTISTKKSDFLLKNWNIYHLHLEKSLKWKPYQNSNLLFFQPKDTVVHLIDVKPHPKGNGWFARELLEIVYDNWPDLLIYRDGVKVESIPDDEIYDITKREIVFLSFKNGCLFPTNLGVATSGDSNMAVREADRVFDNLTIWEKELQDREDELREMIVQNSFLVPPKLYFRLEIENGYFIAYEPFCGVKIKMFQS